MLHYAEPGTATKATTQNIIESGVPVDPRLRTKFAVKVFLSDSDVNEEDVDNIIEKAENMLKKNHRIIYKS